MNDPNNSTKERKIPGYVSFIGWAVALFILVICIVLVLLLIYGWQLIYLI